MRNLAKLSSMCALSGCLCADITSQSAVLDRLNPLMTEHAAALAGDDVNAMRRTGRTLIATYDAGVGE